jgi:hypothetical protein
VLDNRFALLTAKARKRFPEIRFCTRRIFERTVENRFHRASLFFAWTVMRMKRSRIEVDS